MEFWKMFKILNSIPKGSVMTYKELAEELGTSPRAVGKMLSLNPFPVLVPCHRIINSNRDIGGYSMGREKKEELLRNEGFEIKKGKIM
ncbi:MAG: MGMT family protein [Candidatus Nanoarchaeia archaeon]|nr:MGMT family protein [Candidatus Nanoarchaeia archaeon]